MNIQCMHDIFFVIFQGDLLQFSLYYFFYLYLFLLQKQIRFDKNFLLNKKNNQS